LCQESPVVERAGLLEMFDTTASVRFM